MDYMLARHYPASLGRFPSVDRGADVEPENPHSWSLSGDVRSNLVNATDPMGLFPLRAMTMRRRRPRLNGRPIRLPRPRYHLPSSSFNSPLNQS